MSHNPTIIENCFDPMQCLLWTICMRRPFDPSCLFISSLLGRVLVCHRCLKLPISGHKMKGGNKLAPLSKLPSFHSTLSSFYYQHYEVIRLSFWNYLTLRCILATISFFLFSIYRIFNILFSFYFVSSWPSSTKLPIRRKSFA